MSSINDNDNSLIQGVEDNNNSSIIKSYDLGTYEDREPSTNSSQDQQPSDNHDTNTDNTNQ